MNLFVIVAMAVMFGLAASIVLPIVYLAALGPHGRWLGGLARTIALTSVYRPAFTVNDVGDLLLKKREYNDELNVEELSVGGITRELNDPQGRIHKWRDIPVGLVDEITGTVFDPRDADIGQTARDHWENASLVHPYSGGDSYVERVRAFFELEEGTRGVGLSSIRYLVGGGSDANAAERVIEHYRKSQSPRSKSTMLRQMFIPVGMFLLVVLVGWFAFNQTGGTAPTGGSSQTVGFLVLLAAPAAALERVRERLDEVPNRVLAVAGVSAIAGLGVELMLLTMMPLLLIVVVHVAFLAGFVFLPGVAFFLGRLHGVIGVPLAKLYFVLSFLPYQEPVVVLDDGQYRVREGTEEEFEVEPSWYRFAKTWLGFTYENNRDAWPEGTAERAESVKAYGESVRADGGDKAMATDRGLPPKYTVAESIEYAGHQGFVPQDPSADDVFVRSHHSLSWYRDVCRGNIIAKAHQYAKEKYGGGEQGMQNKTVLFLTVIMMTFGLLLDYLAFFS